METILVKRKYEVKYRVSGFEGERTVGPFDLDTAEEELRDIAGYMGVTDARIVIADTSNETWTLP